MEKQKNLTVSEQKRQQIVQAATHLVSKFGYAKTTMDDIARLLNMKKTSLYYYYQSKEEILEEVVRSEAQNYLQAIKANLSQKKATYSKIQEYIRTKIRYLKEAIHLYDLSTKAFLEISTKIHSIIEDIHAEEIAILTNIIKEGIKKKELVSCNAQKIAESIVTISEAVKYKELYTAKHLYMNDMDFEKIENDINYILGLLFKGLKPVDC